MIHQILGLLLFISAAQNVGSVQPDISFTGANHRFDLTAMMRTQDNVNRESLTEEEEESDSEIPSSDEDYRRSNKQDNDEAKHTHSGIKKTKHSSAKILSRRADAFEGNFAEDDRTNSFEGGTASDFEDNLKDFQLKYIKPPSRRNLNDDKRAEQLLFMKNAFPITLKVQGYLRAPLE